VDGNKHGKGKFVWADGSVFEGDFRNNVIEGIGMNKAMRGNLKKLP